MPISPRRVAGSTYLRTLKKKTYSTFKRHDCMEGKSVADERGRRERKFSERRRSEALVREECERGGFRTSDEKVILQQVA